MARTVKTADERYNELVSAAKNLFFTKGYENTSVNDIVSVVGVAQGTFYYYFDSKSAVLVSVIEALTSQYISILDSIIANQELTAINKFNQLFQLIGNWKVGQKDELLALLRILRMDANIVLMYQFATKNAQKIAPKFAQIIQEGVAEGVFDTPNPLEAAEFILSIHRSLSDTTSNIFLNPERYTDPFTITFQKFQAAQTAVERMLRAPTGSLPFIQKEILSAWFKQG